MKKLHPFDTLEKNISETMEKLEKQEFYETSHDIDKKLRLRQIPRETGEFMYQALYHYGKLVNKPIIGIEIGTSGGYSGIWQALGLRRIGTKNNKIFSLENDPKKLSLARENIHNCNLEHIIDIIEIDAEKYLENQRNSHKKFNYFFIDAEKEDYAKYYTIIKDLAQNNAILFADNVISHENELKDFLELIAKDEGVISTIIPIGKGLAEVIFTEK